MKKKSLYPERKIYIEEILTKEFLTFIALVLLFILGVIFAIGEKNYYNINLESSLMILNGMM